MFKVNNLLLKVILAFFLLIVVGCDGDNFQDKSVEEKIMREAVCVVASERFFLFDEAQKHYEHGFDASELRYRMDGTPTELPELVNQFRKVMINLPKEHSAQMLEEKCDKRLTNREFKQA